MSLAAFQYACNKASSARQQLMAAVGNNRKIFVTLMDYVNEYSSAHVDALAMVFGGEVAGVTLSFCEKDWLEYYRDAWVGNIRNNIVMHDKVILRGRYLVSRENLRWHMKNVRERTVQAYYWYPFSRERVALEKITRRLNCMLSMLKKAHGITFDEDANGDWVITVDGFAFHLKLCVDDENFIHLHMLPALRDVQI